MLPRLFGGGGAKVRRGQQSLRQYSTKELRGKYEHHTLKNQGLGKSDLGDSGVQQSDLGTWGFGPCTPLKNKTMQPPLAIYCLPLGPRSIKQHRGHTDPTVFYVPSIPVVRRHRAHTNSLAYGQIPLQALRTNPTAPLALYCLGLGPVMPPP